MSSTYSPLKIELQATGENATTWGVITNANLEALEEALAYSADVTFASGDVTISLTNTNASQAARSMRLRCTGTTGGARNLTVPTIEKVYLVQNACADQITVKTAAGTGVAVPAGKTMWLYVDATNVVDAVNHLSSLTVAGTLAVTGATTLSSTLAATGAVTMASTLAVTGNATFVNDVDTDTLSVTTSAELGSGAESTTTVTGTFTAENAVNFSTNIDNYANDAAAAIGGVPVSGIYRNGSVLMIRVT